MDRTLLLRAMSLEDLSEQLGNDRDDPWIKAEVIRRIQEIPNVVPAAHTDDVFRCGYCGMWFAAHCIRSLRTHLSYAPGTCANGFTPDHKCDCGKTFESVDRAETHYINTGSCLRARLEREKERKARFCEPCQHQSIDKKAFAKHCSTKAHHKAIHPDEFYCQPCDHRSRCTTEHQAHLASKSHKQGVEPVVLRCEVCDVICQSKSHYDRHMAGKQHLYKAEPSKRPTLTCDLCGITRPSQAQYQAHLATSKHRKKASACLEDPRSPDDEDASDSPDTQAPSPVHSPPPVC